MISRNQIKLIQSLRQQKFRKEHGFFVAEGQKIVQELMGSAIRVKSVYALKDWVENNRERARNAGVDLHEVSPGELERISNLTTPNKALALCRIPEMDDGNTGTAADVTLALDGIRDPGNLGTIIRTADWFGVDRIICSDDCVDVYNPKVVQATMGSIARVKVYYARLEEQLAGKEIPVYATVLDGQSIWEAKPGKGIYVIGNESAGIRPEVLKLATHRISIPKTGRAESLNASVATGIILAAIEGQQG